MSNTEGAASTRPDGGSHEDIHFYSDGYKLRGVLITPAGSGPHPALVYTHGWSGAVNDRVLPLMGKLAAAGFLGLALDHRGFAGSEGPRGRCDPREQVRDVSNAVTYLTSRHDVDASSIAVLGASFGGAIAIGAAAADDRVAAVVSLVGIGDAGRWLRDLHRYSEWYAVEQRLAQDAVRRVLTGVGERVDFGTLMPGPAPVPPDDPTRLMYPDGYPLENIALARDFRPEEMIASIAPRAACLIGVADDTVVPLSETQRLYERAGEPRQLVVQPTGNHGGPMGPNLEHTAATIVDFLRRHAVAPAAVHA
jgi:alpha-beta hydrolase superfamily lysophospholipase